MPALSLPQWCCIDLQSHSYKHSNHDPISQIGCSVCFLLPSPNVNCCQLFASFCANLIAGPTKTNCGQHYQLAADTETKGTKIIEKDQYRLGSCAIIEWAKLWHKHSPDRMSFPPKSVMASIDDDSYHRSQSMCSNAVQSQPAANWIGSILRRPVIANHHTHRHLIDERTPMWFWYSTFYCTTHISEHSLSSWADRKQYWASKISDSQ